MAEAGRGAPLEPRRRPTFRVLRVKVQTRLAGRKTVTVLVPNYFKRRSPGELMCVVNALAKLGGLGALQWGTTQGLAQPYRTPAAKINSMLAAAYARLHGKVEP